MKPTVYLYAMKTSINFSVHKFIFTCSAKPRLLFSPAGAVRRRLTSWYVAWGCTGCPATQAACARAVGWRSLAVPSAKRRWLRAPRRCNGGDPGKFFDLSRRLSLLSTETSWKTLKVMSRKFFSFRFQFRLHIFKIIFPYKMFNSLKKVEFISKAWLYLFAWWPDNSCVNSNFMYLAAKKKYKKRM